MIITCVSILIGLLLSACSAPTANTPASTATQPPVVAPVPTSTGEPLPADVLAIYHKSGCFQGVDEKLIIRTDGVLIFTGTHGAAQQAQVAANQLTALQTLLAQPEFAQLQPLYQAMGADLCVYTITARHNGQPFSVTTMDGAETPEFLQQVLQEIEQLRTIVR
jgi:hypothetical protein